MEISAELAADLAALTETLDENDDLESTLHDFGIAAHLAVPSYLGMSVTVIGGGHEISFMVPEHVEADRTIATSLLVPLSDLAGTGAGSFMVLYAATPGAFVDLAADLGYALQVGHDELILDAHLTPTTEHPGIEGLTEMGLINQAIGILIERGYAAHSASSELHQPLDDALHALWNEWSANALGGADDAADEQAIRAITQPLLALLRDNPDLVAALLEVDP
jgi:hypothetical protein